MKVIKNHNEMEIISKEDFEKVQQVLKGKNKDECKNKTSVLKKSEPRQKSPIPPGYKMVEGKLVINEAEADVIKEQISNYVNSKCGEIGE